MQFARQVRKSVFGGRGGKFTSGLDFRDAGGPGQNEAGSPPPPMPDSKPPRYLARNKTERARTQGLNLVRSNSTLSTEGGASAGPAPLTRKQRFNIWMINEGSRRIFFGVFIILHMMVFAFGFVHYQLKDNLSQARSEFGITFAIARASALTLHFEVALILIPVCRNFISWLRISPLGDVIPFDKNILFHRMVGWSIALFSFIHIAAHMVNFIRLAISTETGVVGFIGANFLTGPGATGWIMTLVLAIMVWYAMEKRRRQHFERFWYSHHMFIIFFVGWQLHGMFCMIKPDNPPYCSANTIGVFWKYWLLGGVIWIYERILREVRARHKTYISKVIQHPSRVMEIQIKKERTTTRAGQYIFLNCPELSYWQWHPFTLTSAPEEDYISVHVRQAGDFTKSLHEALGGDVGGKPKGDKKEGGKGDESYVVNPPTNVVLPRVMIDGPFGSASEDFHKFEAVMLCGAGIGVTPFASILKHIWYTKNDAKRPTRLRKVYFFWICRDADAFSWFTSLLSAIEEQDLENFVEIHTYLTAKLKNDDLENLIVGDVGSEKDTITQLRSPTRYGRPNWDQIFQSVAKTWPDSDVGVFYCGPKVLGSTLHQMCTKHSSPEAEGTHYVWGKENF